MADKMSEQKTILLEWLRKYWLSIVGWGGAVLLIYNFSKLWTLDADLDNFFTAIVGLLALAAVLLVKIRTITKSLRVLWVILVVGTGITIIILMLSSPLFQASDNLSGAGGGTKVDLSGDLRGRDFSDQNLAGVDLTGRDLTGANLSGATLNRATIANVIFDAINGTSTIFTSTKASGASFVGARLDNADFSRADLTGANFSGANLTGAKLSDATLTDVIYTDTTIWPAGFNPFTAGAKLVSQTSSATPHPLTVTSTVSGGVKLNINLIGADLSGKDISGANLSGRDLTGVNLRNAVATNVNFNAANLQNVLFIGTDLRYSSFLGAICNGADFSGANLSNATGLITASFVRATYSASTIWPVGFDPVVAGLTLPSDIPPTTRTPTQLVYPNPTQTILAVFKEIDNQFQNLQKANIAFNKPKQMKKGATSYIELIISPSLSQSTLAAQVIERGGLITSTAEPDIFIAPSGETVVLETSQIEITPRIKAFLTSQDSAAFVIEERHLNPEQVVSSIEPTIWRWSIIAKKEGQQTLDLTVYQLVKYDGKEFWHEVETYKANIVVDVTAIDWLKSLDWKWIFATLLVPSAGGLITWWLGHKQKREKTQIKMTEDKKSPKGRAKK